MECTSVLALRTLAWSRWPSHAVTASACDSASRTAGCLALVLHVDLSYKRENERRPARRVRRARAPGRARRRRRGVWRGHPADARARNEPDRLARPGLYRPRSTGGQRPRAIDDDGGHADTRRPQPADLPADPWRQPRADVDAADPRAPVRPRPHASR